MIKEEIYLLTDIELMNAYDKEKDIPVRQSIWNELKIRGLLQ